MHWLRCSPEAGERLAIQPVHERQEKVLGQVLETRCHIDAICAAVPITASIVVVSREHVVRHARQVRTCELGGGLTRDRIGPITRSYVNTKEVSRA